MGAALPIAAIAMTAGSSILGGVQEASALRAEARQNRENGRLAIKSGEEQAMDVLRQARFEQGGAAASMAGSGLAFGGSIGTVLADSAYQAEMDIDRVRARASGEADNYYAQAKQNRKAAKGAIVSGIFNAVASAVSSAADMSNQNKLGKAKMGAAG